MCVCVYILPIGVCVCVLPIDVCGNFQFCWWKKVLIQFGLLSWFISAIKMANKRTTKVLNKDKDMHRSEIRTRKYLKKRKIKAETNVFQPIVPDIILGNYEESQQSGMMSDCLEFIKSQWCLRIDTIILYRNKEFTVYCL